MKLHVLLEKGAVLQVGVIVFGKTLNPRYWIEEAKKKGYMVLISDGHARLYK